MASRDKTQMIALGYAVRYAIKAADLTLAQVSQQTGIMPTTLSRRMNGSMPFKLSELVKIARVCGVKVSDLVFQAEQLVAMAEAREPASDAAEGPDDGAVAVLPGAPS